MKLYIPLFSLTLLLSATLLFSVQPMFSKMILPLLGGTPQVWNTAMLFFQAFLLAGYGYAHLTSHYLSHKVQAVLHIVLLCAFSIILPIIIPAGWEPTLDTDPSFWQMSVMAAIVGGPFFVVSGSAPMLQHWFSATSHKDAQNPYFLYGASNLGSMVALLSYPTLIEPMMNITQQSNSWMYGYFVLIILTSGCAALTWKNAKNTTIVKSQNKEKDDKVTTAQRLKWIALSAIPSSLMLGVTTYITTDIASVPLLWILPFALYVSTFIIVFARKQLFTEKQVMTMSGLAIALLIVQMISLKDVVNYYPFLLVAVHMVVFFTITLACHFNLAQAKPQASHLTEFYFFMSLGGVLGGIFNALLAPNFFLIPVEYAIAIAAALIMRYSASKDYNAAAFKKLNINHVIMILLTAFLAYAGFFLISNAHVMALTLCSMIAFSVLTLTLNTKWLFGSIASAIILCSPVASPISIFNNSDVILRDRNFFGVHKLLETDKERKFISGITDHGTQLLKEEDKLTRISYYSEHSPLTDVFNYLDKQETPQHIGGLGLGIGVIACYQHPNRSFDFYEIDKDVADLAENTKYFTYLSDCGSPYEIFIGDGRLETAKQNNAIYDAIVIDVFTSDNIPVHIITQEAIEMYLRKLKEDGILVMHISNKYLDLEPVIHEIAKNINIPAYGKFVSKSFPIKDIGVNSYPAHYITLTHSADAATYITNHGWTPTMPREGVRAWTDQYSNILNVLGNYTAGIKRVQINADAGDAE